MKTLSGDIDYSIEDGFLILHTNAGDVIIGLEELEVLQGVIAGILEDG